jgi:hypothetical protein
VRTCVGLITTGRELTEARLRVLILTGAPSLSVVFNCRTMFVTYSPRPLAAIRVRWLRTKDGSAPPPLLWRPKKVFGGRRRLPEQ